MKTKMLTQFTEIAVYHEPHGTHFYAPVLSNANVGSRYAYSKYDAQCGVVCCVSMGTASDEF
jgi:hypothetical protein